MGNPDFVFEVDDDETVPSTISEHKSDSITQPIPLKQRLRSKLESYRKKLDTSNQLDIENNNPTDTKDIKDIKDTKDTTDTTDIKDTKDTTDTTDTKEYGWNQGDGKRADNLVIYESNIPSYVKSRIEPIKGTHFHFIHKNDEDTFLRTIESINHFTATYYDKGPRDITITSNNELIGNIHLLHMNKTDIHNPSKYFVKLYLFNFKDAETLKQVKDVLISFFKTFSKKVNIKKRNSFYTHKKSRRNRNMRKKKWTYKKFDRYKK
jgi:hypothetical protein